MDGLRNYGLKMRMGLLELIKIMGDAKITVGVAMLDGVEDGVIFVVGDK